jgi:hypothetical protein
MTLAYSQRELGEGGGKGSARKQQPSTVCAYVQKRGTIETAIISAELIT